LAQGHGLIVNVSSIAGKEGNATLACYYAVAADILV